MNLSLKMILLSKIQKIIVLIFAGIQLLETLFYKNNPVLKDLKPEQVVEYFNRVVEIVNNNLSEYPLDLTTYTGDIISANIWDDIMFVTTSMLPTLKYRVEAFLIKESSTQGHIMLEIYFKTKNDRYADHIFTKMKACIVKQGVEYKNTGLLK